MAWALWVDDEHRAVRTHLHFDVLKGVPVEATVTEGNASETAQLRATFTTTPNRGPLRPGPGGV